MKKANAVTLLQFAGFTFHVRLNKQAWHSSQLTEEGLPVRSLVMTEQDSKGNMRASLMTVRRHSIQTTGSMSIQLAFNITMREIKEYEQRRADS